MSGYLQYELWTEHLSDLRRAAARDHMVERGQRPPAPRPVRARLRRLRRALAA
ncbi:MAG: hypothetical protein ABW135_00770 [Thermoleophilaceae bacterium]